MRAVAAMDIGVTVQATTRHRPQLRCTGGTSGGQRCDLTGVTGMAVAFLAEERGPRLEQVEDRRAMAAMADGAVFRHRLVVMHERSALLHVALVAGLVDAGLFQLLGVVAVDVVAVRTPHFAFQHRMMGRAIELGTLLLVATEAQLGLGCPRAHAVVGGVNLVAVGASDAAVGVGAAVPVHAVTAFVTVYADGVAISHRSRSRSAEFSEVAVDQGLGFDRFVLPAECDVRF